jgi:hypothetical protein
MPGSAVTPSEFGWCLLHTFLAISTLGVSAVVRAKIHKSQEKTQLKAHQEAQQEARRKAQREAKRDMILDEHRYINWLVVVIATYNSGKFKFHGYSNGGAVGEYISDPNGILPFLPLITYQEIYAACDTDKFTEWTEDYIREPSNHTYMVSVARQLQSISWERERKFQSSENARLEFGDAFFVYPDEKGNETRVAAWTRYQRTE